MQFKNFLWLRLKDHDVYVMNLYWKESAPLFQSARAFANYFIHAVFSVQWFLFRPIAALQAAVIKNLFHFYSSPVALGQIYCLGFDPNQSQRTIPISWNGCLPDWSLSMTGVIHVGCPCLLTLFVNSGTRSSATSKNVRLKNWIASSGSSCMSNTFHGAFSRSSWKACSLKFSHLRYLMVFSMFWIDLFRYFVTMPTGRWSDIPKLSTLVIRICWGRSMYTWSKQVLFAGRAISLISWFSPRLEVYLRRRWLTWSSFNAFMFMSPKSSIFLSVLYLIEGFLQLLVHIRRRF